MSTDAPQPSQRPRPWLLVMLAAVVIAALVYWQWPAASPVPPPSNQPGARQGAKPGGGPAAPGVHLEALKQPPPEPSGSERNPFRFQPKPPPTPPAPPPSAMTQRVVPVEPPQPIGPPPIPAPPPIPLKFIGTLEARGPGKVAIFSDGKGMVAYAHEGEAVFGEYRLVRIGVESAVLEYLDGRGRQTIPLRGQ